MAGLGAGRRPPHRRRPVPYTVQPLCRLLIGPLSSCRRWALRATSVSSARAARESPSRVISCGKRVWYAACVGLWKVRSRRHRHAYPGPAPALSPSEPTAALRRTRAHEGASVGVPRDVTANGGSHVAVRKAYSERDRTAFGRGTSAPAPRPTGERRFGGREARTPNDFPKTSKVSRRSPTGAGCSRLLQGNPRRQTVIRWLVLFWLKFPRPPGFAPQGVPFVGRLGQKHPHEGGHLWPPPPVLSACVRA